MYFQKIRAFSDFALDIPYNPAQIEENMATLTAALTDAHRESLAGRSPISKKIWKIHASNDPLAKKGCRGISFPLHPLLFRKNMF